MLAFDKPAEQNSEYLLGGPHRTGPVLDGSEPPELDGSGNVSGRLRLKLNGLLHPPAVRVVFVEGRLSNKVVVVKTLLLSLAGRGTARPKGSERRSTQTTTNETTSQSMCSAPTPNRSFMSGKTFDV